MDDNVLKEALTANMEDEYRAFLEKREELSFETSYRYQKKMKKLLKSEAGKKNKVSGIIRILRPAMGVMAAAVVLWAGISLYGNYFVGGKKDGQAEEVNKDPDNFANGCPEMEVSMEDSFLTTDNIGNLNGTGGYEKYLMPALSKALLSDENSFLIYLEPTTAKADQFVALWIENHKDHIRDYKVSNEVSYLLQVNRDEIKVFLQNKVNCGLVGNDEMADDDGCYIIP